MRNAKRRSYAAAAILLIGMMLTASAVMVLGYTGASDVPDTDLRASDGFFELFGDPTSGPFVENGGQWDDSIRFAAVTSFGHVAFGDDHILFDVRGGRITDDIAGPLPLWETSVTGTIIRMDLLDTNGIEPMGEDRLSTRTNIFHGNDPSKWGTGLGTFGKVVYENIYDGIDLVYDASGPSMKYEFVVEPGADPSNIRFELSGLDSMKIYDDRIEMDTSFGTTLIDGGLVSFYEGFPGEIVQSSFGMNQDGIIGYEISGRDPSRTLVIDPVIYGTYIGGPDDDYEEDMVMDGLGACYLAGTTWSFSFPITSGAYNTRNMGENDGFVMKIYPDGSSPVYSTYIGGSSWDNIYSIAVDESGAAYVGGCSESTDFPTTKGAYNESLNGEAQDLVVFKLDPSGSRLSYSTYIGGSEWDNLNEKGSIVVDARGCAYIAGSSNSKDFPVTEDAFDKENNNTQGGDRGFEWTTSKVVLVKLKADGSDLEYSTYLGGTQDEYASGILLDNEGMVYIIGMTGSKDFPVTKGAFDTSLDGWSSEIFLAKIDIGRSTIVYATLLGGSFDQYVTDIVLDSSGRPYICGWTGSTDFPVMDDTYQHELNGWNDIFVTAFDSTLSSLYMSTFIGGSEGEQAYSIDMDGNGNVMITGGTASSDYPTIVTHAEPMESRDGSILITLLDPLGQELVYSTLVGGSTSPMYPEDVGYNIFSTGERRVVVSGYTGCSDFPITEDAYDNTLGGGADLILMEFDLSLPPAAPQNLSIQQGDGSLNLTWDLPEDDGGMPILGYEVYKGLREDDLKIENKTIKELYLNDTDLDMGKTYYYLVRAYNFVGTGLPSEIVSSQAACSPTSPQFFQVKRGNGWVKLSWEPPVFDGSYGLEGYRLHKSADGGSPELIDLDTSKLEYYDTKVQNGVNYTYCVTTWNIIGESLPTAELWVIPQGEPSPPTGLLVVNGSGSIQLSWSPPLDDGGSEILFYRVYIGITKEEQVRWRYVNTPSTEYIDDLAEIGKTYRYYVTAVNSEGESSPSVVVEGQPQSEPSSPENFKISEGNGYLILTWDAPSFLGGIELQGFRLYRSEGSSEALLLKEFAFDEMMYKDRNVTNGVTYTYKVTAFNLFGESEGAEEVQGTPAAVPEAPTGLIATASDSMVELTWTASASNGGAPLLEYQIFRKISGGEFQEIGSVSSGTLSYTDTDVDAGTSYTYSVKAGNRMGASQFSDEAETVALGVPSAPLNVVYTAGDGFIDISWEAPSNNGGSTLTGYIVLRSDPELENLLIAAELGPEATSHKDEDVLNGGSYIYTVNAVNAIGESLPLWSDIQVPLGTPGTPGSFAVSADGTVVTLGWEVPAQNGGSDIQLYRIYRVIGTDAPILIGVVEAGTTSFVDDSDKEDGTYTYKVVAVNSIGESKVAAQTDIEVSAEDAAGGFFSENIGLVITVPIILLLLVLLVIIMARKKDDGGMIEPVPQPASVDQYPAEDQFADPNGYLDGYPQEERGGVEEFDQLMPANSDMEQ